MTPDEWDEAWAGDCTNPCRICEREEFYTKPAEQHMQDDLDAAVIDAQIEGLA